MMKKVLLFSVLGLSGADNIVEKILNDDRFSSLETLLTGDDADTYSSFVAMLQDESKQFTLFAPSNKAFSDGTVPNGSADILKTLNLHTIGSSVPSSALSETPAFLTSLLTDGVVRNGDGQFITAVIDNGVAKAGGATISATDIDCENGVIHIVDDFIPIPQSTSAIASSVDDLSKLVAALDANGLVETVDETASITIFAPENENFPDDPTFDGAARTLQNHVVPGTFFSTDLEDGAIVKSVSGANLKVKVDNTGTYVNGAKVKSANVISENAVIHILEDVIPSNNILDAVVADNDLKKLVEIVPDAVKDILSDEASSFTLFAPTDAAFDKIATVLPNLTPEAVLEILQYHLLQVEVQSSAITDVPQFLGTSLIEELRGDEPQVLQAAIIGGAPKINDAGVSEADIACQNGFIHKVDTVLLPPKSTSEVATDNKLDTLVSSLATASLVDFVDTTPKLTIFAPLDAAFEGLTISEDNLADVLKSHVVEGAIVYSTALTPGQKVTTVEGYEATVTIDDDGEVSIDDAKVVAANVLTKNAVVHVIDGVLNAPAAPPTSGVSMAKPFFSAVLIALGIHNFLGF